MPGDAFFVPDAAATSVLFLLAGYSSYRGFEIRGSLSTGMYRKQALWVGSISLIFLVVFAVDFLFAYVLSYNGLIDLAVSVLNGAGIFTMFAWVDNSTLIARRSDPLLRNTIRWSLLRRPLWVLLLGSYGVAIVVSALNIGSGRSLAGSPSPLITATLSVVLLVPFAFGAILLPLDVKRTGDFVLRRHLKWIGVQVLSIFGVTLLYGSILLSGQGTGYLDLTKVALSDPATNLAFYALALVFGYAFLRSAGSLAPINKIRPDDTLR